MSNLSKLRNQTLQLLGNEHFQRLWSNYFRMALTFIFGLWFIRTLLQLGASTYAAAIVVISAVALAMTLKEVIRIATIPAIGSTFPGDERENASPEKVAQFAAALGLSTFFGLIAALLSAIGLLVFLWFLPGLAIDPPLLEASRIFLITRLISLVPSIATTPLVNIFTVSRKMVAYNVWQTIERFLELASALVVANILLSSNAADNLITFAYISMFAMLAVTLLRAYHAFCVVPVRMRDVLRIDWAGLRDMTSLFGWNTVAVLSSSIYFRLDLIVISAFHGVAATVMFGLAAQFASYARILSMGIVFGLDSLASSTKRGDGKRDMSGLHAMSRNTLALQAWTLLGCAVFFVVNAEPLIVLLFGEDLGGGADVALIANTFSLLIIGVVARGFSEGWMGLLGGIGEVKRYSTVISVGALIYPIALLVIYPNTDLKSALLATGITFCAINFIFFFFGVGFVFARTTSARLSRTFLPAVLPLAVACLTGLACQMITIDYSEFHKLVVTFLIISIVIGPFFLVSLVKSIRA